MSRDISGSWQPIASAPRDGTKIMLWAEVWEMSWGVQTGTFADGVWHTSQGTVADNDPDFDSEAEVGEDIDVEDDRNCGPTHWQPHPSIHKLS